MDIQESALIAQIQAGKTAAFAELYDRYIKRIYRFVYAKTGHRETAEDLTGQIFLKALEKIKSFNQHRGSFSAWLYTIARTAIIDHYRESHPTNNIDDHWDLTDGKNPVEQTETALLFAKIKPQLNKLSSM